MRINVYLSFDGRCREAFEAYAALFGGKIEFLQTVGEAPDGDKAPPERRGEVMHATLRLGDELVMGADAPPEWRSRPAGFSMSVNAPDLAEGRRIFGALAEGGEVKMPFGPTFWAQGFGMAIDRFEIPWMVNVQAVS